MKTSPVNQAVTTGPFGLRMGMAGSDVGTELTMIRPFVFVPNTVPKPHPALRT